MKASLSGVKPEEVDISITGDVLIIKGEHKEAQEVIGRGLPAQGATLRHLQPLSDYSGTG